MEKYYSRTKTPLNFHKFFWYFLLPVNLVALFLVLTAEAKGLFQYAFNWLSLYAVVVNVFLLVLVILSFIGFFSWRLYSWYAVMTLFVVGFLYNLSAILIAFVVYGKADPTDVSTAFGAFLRLMFFGLYYLKRRPLFGEIPQPERIINATAEIEELPITEIRCEKCGQLLADGQRFCPNCGQATVQPPEVTTKNIKSEME